MILGVNMSSFSFLISKIGKINKSRLSGFVDRISKDNHKPKLYVYADMVINFLIYGISYTDYMKGNYINLSHKEKKTFITERKYYKLVTYLNKEEYRDVLLDKIKFNDVFKDYMGRDYLDLRKASVNDFKKFVQNKKDFFAKKHNSCGGDGVEKIIVKEHKSIPNLYKELLEKEQFLVEETIIQHDYLNKINPVVVNNLRIVTLLKDDIVHLIATTIRLNTGKDEAINCDDIFATLDENGHILGNMVDADFNIYKKHPVTRFDFKNLKVPYTKEAIELCKKAALEVPEMRYIGWDVAITPKGPVLIEGNYYPSYGLFQYYLFDDGKEVGKYKMITDILKEETKNL